MSVRQKAQRTQPHYSAKLSSSRPFIHPTPTMHPSIPKHASAMYAASGNVYYIKAACNDNANHRPSSAQRTCSTHPRSSFLRLAKGRAKTLPWRRLPVKVPPCRRLDLATRRPRLRCAGTVALAVSVRPGGAQETPSDRRCGVQQPLRRFGRDGRARHDTRRRLARSADPNHVFLPTEMSGQMAIDGCAAQRHHGTRCCLPRGWGSLGPSCGRRALPISWRDAASAAPSKYIPPPRRSDQAVNSHGFLGRGGYEEPSQRNPKQSGKPHCCRSKSGPRNLSRGSWLNIIFVVGHASRKPARRPRLLAHSMRPARRNGRLRPDSAVLVRLASGHP